MSGRPYWKTVDCPAKYCRAKVGSSCGKQKLGANWWVRTAPHAARKRVAKAILESWPKPLP